MNRRILITRSIKQSSALAEQLAACGFDPLLIPAIELVDPTSFATLDTALAHLDTFHWLLFTSANAVEAFHRRWACTPKQLPQGSGADLVPQGNATNLVPQGSATNLIPQGSATKQVPQGFSLGSHGVAKEAGFSPEVCFPPGLQIASIGPATARALESVGLTPTLTPPQAVAESLAEALLPHARQPDGTPTRFLLVRAEQARDHLPDTLRSAGAEITIAPAYRTVIPEASIAAIRDLFSHPANYPAAITFTSSSTAINLIALLNASGLTLPPDIPRISIGPVTSQALCDLNLPPTAESPTPTIPDLTATVFEALKTSQSPSKSQTQSPSKSPSKSQTNTR